MLSRSAVHDRELLSPPHIDSVLTRLESLRQRWVQRHPEGPFHTFGAPSYLDGDPHDDHVYRTRAAHANPLLRQHFTDVLNLLRNAISDHVGAPADFDDALGLPGFHVFEAHPAFRKLVASIHVDRQYRSIRWPHGTVLDESQQLSATLSLRMPTGGGGRGYAARQPAITGHGCRRAASVAAPQSPPETAPLPVRPPRNPLRPPVPSGRTDA